MEDSTGPCPSPPPSLPYGLTWETGKDRTLDLLVGREVLFQGASVCLRVWGARAGRGLRVILNLGSPARATGAVEGGLEALEAARSLAA